MQLYGILFAFLIFVNFFESYIPYFNYWDELFTIAIIFWLIFRCRKISAKDIILWMALIGIVLLGLLGNFIHPGIQENNSIIIRDILASTKFFIVTFALQNYHITFEKQKRLTKVAANISRITIIIMIIVAAIAYPFNTKFYIDDIRIFKPFQFIFSHPTFLVTACVLMMTVLIADSVARNKVFIICNCIIIFLAQRDKGYVALALAIIILVLGENKCARYLNSIVESSKKSIWRWRAIGILSIMVIAAYMIGREKINLYLGWGLTAARPALYIVGFRIASDFFPLGAGFGTFASTLSTRSYSRIYDMYHISGVLGLTREDFSYVGDVFWPYVYGQFGFVGLILYIQMIYCIVKRQLKNVMRSSDRLAVIYLWIYILVASTAEAYFTNATGVQSAIILSIFIGCNFNKRKECSNKIQ